MPFGVRLREPRAFFLTGLAGGVKLSVAGVASAAGVVVVLVVMAVVGSGCKQKVFFEWMILMTVGFCLSFPFLLCSD